MTNQEQRRGEALTAILESSAPKKLAVAGPGTGKTYTFRELLKRIRGNSLALTFIRALADDLALGLGDTAETYTFHGFCKRLLHSVPTNGITLGVSYYPPLMQLIVEDLVCIGDRSIDSRDIDHGFHHLASAGLVDACLRSGTYYDAVSHLDAVYRVFRHLEANPDDIPTYDQIVVDEYQDFSLLEVKFIAALATRSPILVVGDDDQALYGFRHASAVYIRDLAADPDYERFELPFCSRCTSVLVDAVHTVIKRAKGQGNLAGRIDKQYECYLPDKAPDSERYPKIVHAQCSVQNKKAPYVAKYIHQRILEIPADEVAASVAGGYATVLVTGPSQFIGPIYDYLGNYFNNIVLKKGTPLDVVALDGYRRLAANATSRRGWRIVLHFNPVRDLCNVLRNAIVEGEELADLLPARYREVHLHVAELVRRLRVGEALTVQEIAQLESSTAMSYKEIVVALKLDDEDDGPQSSLPEIEDTTSPTIIVTTLVGSKGLQAGHVFVVGVNEGHFPRSNSGITDDEVCSLLVALTRAKKSCTLVSCGRFGGAQLKPSAFVAWLRPHLTPVKADKAFFGALTQPKC